MKFGGRPSPCAFVVLQIRELILDNCYSTTVVGLTDEFVNLEVLSLIKVGLTNLKNFPNLPNLRRLELGENRIMSGLQALQGSPKLAHLSLSNNRIKDLETLEPLVSTICLSFVSDENGKLCGPTCITLCTIWSEI